MTQTAYQLLAKLRHLTLVGYEDGDYLWSGTGEQWSWIDKEEESILRDNDLNKI